MVRDFNANVRQSGRRARVPLVFVVALALALTICVLLSDKALAAPLNQTLGTETPPAEEASPVEAPTEPAPRSTSEPAPTPASEPEAAPVTEPTTEPVEGGSVPIPSAEPVKTEPEAPVPVSEPVDISTPAPVVEPTPVSTSPVSETIPDPVSETVPAESIPEPTPVETISVPTQDPTVDTVPGAEPVHTKPTTTLVSTEPAPLQDQQLTEPVPELAPTEYATDQVPEAAMVSETPSSPLPPVAVVEPARRTTPETSPEQHIGQVTWPPSKTNTDLSFAEPKSFRSTPVQSLSEPNTAIFKAGDAPKDPVDEIVDRLLASYRQKGAAQPVEKPSTSPVTEFTSSQRSAVDAMEGNETPLPLSDPDSPTTPAQVPVSLKISSSNSSTNTSRTSNGDGGLLALGALVLYLTFPRNIESLCSSPKLLEPRSTLRLTPERPG